MKKKGSTSFASVCWTLLTVLGKLLLVFAGYILGTWHHNSPNLISNHTLIPKENKSESLGHSLPQGFPNIKRMADPVGIAPTEPVQMVTILNNDELEPLKEQLQIFESTLKSCLGRNCIDISFPTGKSGANQDRYGVLSPSITIHSQNLYQGLQTVAAGSSAFLYTSNVPTYGYGRNHGWTRIIRLTDNVALQAYLDIVPYFRNAEQSAISVKGVPISLENAYVAQLRALFRWHCRLNHVAAHTSMLTISSKDLAENPQFTTQSILSFLNVKNPTLFQEFYMRSDVLHHEIAYDLSSLPKSLWQIATTTLKDEMQRSRNMTKWPCLPFRELSAQLVAHNHRFFAPNCSQDNGYPKCSVNYDFAEQKE